MLKHELKNTVSPVEHSIVHIILHYWCINCGPFVLEFQCDTSMKILDVREGCKDNSSIIIVICIVVWIYIYVGPMYVCMCIALYFCGSFSCINFFYSYTSGHSVTHLISIKYFVTGVSFGTSG
jgi:hypothetical protein